MPASDKNGFVGGGVQINRELEIHYLHRDFFD